LAGSIVLCLVLRAVGPAQGGARREDGTSRTPRASEEEFAAKRLLRRAEDLLLANENERGVKMLETIVDQYPDSSVRLEAILVLGKHYLSVHDQPKAVGWLRRLNGLKSQDEELRGGRKEIYLEALYLSGVAYFQMRQYGAAFPILRRITSNYPNTVWANQAYYYIGMCHFTQRNWNKAIEALSLVGTFVDPSSPAVEYVEAGRRFFVKIEDADLPVLHRLGRSMRVALGTARGDKESIETIPLAAKEGIFIGSIATQIAPAKPGDGILQVVGGDVITTTYVDNNTQEGQKDVGRAAKTRVVSTAALSFTLGTYQSKAAAAFLGQPLFVLLHDADLDKGDAADTAAVRLVSRFKREADEEAAEAGAEPVGPEEDEEARYTVRDEVTLTLGELGDPPVRTGRFGGRVAVEPAREGQPIDRTDDILSCALDDEVVATYVDELHIGGEAPRQAIARIQVIGELDARPRATQDVVADPVIKAKRNLVEATAYLELARIFKSMGLVKGARAKCDEGLGRVEPILRMQTPIPSSLKEEAFKLKWELHIAAEDYPSAIATCKLFHRLYPDSPFVDQALLGIGKIRLENKEHAQAINVFREILRLPQSQAKAEAQFRIAEATEAQLVAQATARGTPLTGTPEAAIKQYKLCAERYPESQFAGPSLAKLVDHFVEAKDYTQANDLLEQVFQDYPDAQFLDSMLLKWVLVAYRMGDFAKAHEKCTQLIFEYPASGFAEKAKGILPKLEAKLKK
jgi:TolA-binding protein